MEPNALGVLGTGTMGAGIVQLAAQSGYRVTACDAPAVVEAIVEKVEPKKEALAALDTLLSPGSLIFTNTSSISITDLASATGRPEKVCGTHFFTPPPVREAVEVPRGHLTSEETLERAKDLVRSFGKLPIVVEGRPGFRGEPLLDADESSRPAGCWRMAW